MTAITLLDGGTGRELQRHGLVKRGSIWSALALLESPETVVSVHRSYVEAGAVVFMPTGALEQHGPHLPLGVDHMLPTAIALDIAREVGGMVAPAIPYGYKSMTRSAQGTCRLSQTSSTRPTRSSSVRSIRSLQVAQAW